MYLSGIGIIGFLINDYSILKVVENKNKFRNLKIIPSMDLEDTIYGFFFFYASSVILSRYSSAFHQMLFRLEN